MSSVQAETESGKPPSLLRIDEREVHAHVDRVVRQSVEETLNVLLDAEADELCGTQRYERSAERLDTRAGHYQRTLETKAGPVELQVPRLRKLPFESQIIERYRWREASVEEALVQMYLAGVSVRRVEDITEALWGTRRWGFAPLNPSHPAALSCRYGQRAGVLPWSKAAVTVYREHSPGCATQIDVAADGAMPRRRTPDHSSRKDLVNWNQQSRDKGRNTRVAHSARALHSSNTIPLHITTDPT